MFRPSRHDSIFATSVHDDADLKALVCHRTFASRAEAVRTPKLREIPTA